jgi:prepilin-type N-terminal cleavage/methylation domain-containing protein
MTTQRGFTLIELAIVLVIITILIGGLAVPLSAQIQARRIAETNKTLDEAREALVGYAMSHTDNDATAPRPYLPCPDTDNNGTEDRANGGACLQNQGWFPWVTLGTAAQDAWGNRLRYAVTSAFANSSAGFSNANSGTFQVCSASGCATVDVASNVPVVLLSYGPDGWGALNVNGNTLAAPTSDDEKENTNTDVNYVSRTPSRADSASGEFDDLVRWISADQLRGRICPAGGCP